MRRWLAYSDKQRSNVSISLVQLDSVVYVGGSVCKSLASDKGNKSVPRLIGCDRNARETDRNCSIDPFDVSQ